MRIEVEGSLRYLINFGSLLSGETFAHGNKVYIKTDGTLSLGRMGLELETGIVRDFEAKETVHKLNMKAVLDIGNEG